MADCFPRTLVSTQDPALTATVADDCMVCAACAQQWDETGDDRLLAEINNHPHPMPSSGSHADELTRG